MTLGRFSMGRFMPGARITQAHGTTRLADPATGARDATVFAMYHPAYALRKPAVERESYDDVAADPGRPHRRARRAGGDGAATAPRATRAQPRRPAPTAGPRSRHAADRAAADQLSLF